MQGKQNILFLPMKRKWFDLVKSGEKKEEYRLFKKHWQTRIRSWIDSNSPPRVHMHSLRDYGTEWTPILDNSQTHLLICFVNGYQKDAPRFFAECLGVQIRTKSTHPEWGEEEYQGQPHFVLSIGSIKES